MYFKKNLKAKGQSYTPAKKKKVPDVTRAASNNRNGAATVRQSPLERHAKYQAGMQLRQAFAGRGKLIVSNPCWRAASSKQQHARRRDLKGQKAARLEEGSYVRCCTGVNAVQSISVLLVSHSTVCVSSPSWLPASLQYTWSCAARGNYAIDNG